MKKLMLISMILGLIGCGHSDNSAPSTPAAWAHHDQNTFLLGCTTTADTSIPAGTTGSNLSAANTIVDAYCNCVLDAAMAKWSAADFNANAAADAQSLFTDGTVAGCQTAAAE